MHVEGVRNTSSETKSQIPEYLTKTDITYNYDELGQQPLRTRSERLIKKPSRNLQYIKKQQVFILFARICFTCSVVKLLAQNLTICYPLITHTEYYVPRPMRCIYHQQKTIHRCSAKLSNPFNSLIEIAILICQKLEISSSTYFYFFGAKTQEFGLQLFFPLPSKYDKYVQTR